MTDDKNQIPENPSEPGSTGAEQESHRDSRRRLIKGAAVAPVLMSVVSRPVLGAECTISGYMSGNVSDHGHDNCTGGYSPGAWGTPYSGDGNWNTTPFSPGTCKKPGPGQCNEYNADGTPFFGPTTFTGMDSHYAGKSLMQVIWLPGSDDPYQFGAHIVAALLNAYSVAGYGMTPAAVKAIYSNVESNGGPASGYYQGANGQILTVEQVVTFIQATFA